MKIYEMSLNTYIELPIKLRDNEDNEDNGRGNTQQSGRCPPLPLYRKKRPR
jgi:hypothetical protein